MLEFLDILDNQEEIKSKVFSTLHDCITDYGNVVGSNYIGIFHLNIRSINKHLDELLVYIEEVSDNIDVIILSETWNVDVAKANAFNDYFINVGKEMAKTITKPDNLPEDVLNDKSIGPTLLLEPVTEHEIFNIVST
ncbi:hypothetical protein JTB14_011114 [Gonioctena quinquepunctata]|nr:hypothetical protein JTB14_011114 [Gonioctena quinquepunctata]